MQNRIKKFIEEGRRKDDLLLSFNGDDRSVLQNKGYLKQKFRETREFIRQNKRGLNAEEKAWMSMLKVGNRHLEKKLRPNRIVRYGRRAVNALFNFVKDRRAGKAPVEISFSPQAARYAPTADKNKQAVKAATKVARKAAPTITRIVQKNKYAALEDIQKSKGLSIKR